VADIQQWSGLTRLRPVLERMRPDLRVFSDDRGRELFDVPDAPIADPDTPAPPRLLPWWDNILVAYADRRRVVRDEFRRAVVYDYLGRAPVLIDGMVAGFWVLERDKKTTTAALRMHTFEPLARPVRVELEGEALRLIAFAAPDAQCEVVFAEPG
jgi:hypothetical protein